MKDENSINHCKKCHEEVDGKYCSHCGQAKELKRIDRKYILGEIGSVLNFERGILFSIKELLIRPGKNIRSFIQVDRNRLVKPILFIIITSLFYTLLNELFHLEQGYINYENSKNTSTTVLFGWVQQHYGYANIIMGIFIAFWLKLFFRKSEYNFFEILILLCFIMGVGMLILSVFAIVKGVSGQSFMQFASIIGVIYTTWAIGQFFKKKGISAYFKAFASYMLGFLSFGIAVVILGFLIDLIIS